jgi:DNA repair protein RecN (Recombination protein N)
VIERIAVRGMGGITSAELDFSGGFIVITGESGSGKSSLVRAFEFISGKRAQTASIHSGMDETTVEALWSAGRDGTGETLTKRTLNRAGKGRVFIDGAMATAGQLAETTAPMIEIQSQFAQLNLLDASRQLELVDICGGEDLAATKDRLAEVFPAMIELEREVAELRKKKSALEEELEGAPDRVRRIRALKLHDNCEEEWAAELAMLERRLADAGRCEEIARRMSGGEDGIALVDQVGALLRELYDAAPDDARDRWTKLGEAALTNLQELFGAATSELGLISREDLETRYEEAEARIGALRRVKRETGMRTARDLVAYIEGVERGMGWLRDSGAILSEKTARAAEMKTEAGALARRLRAQRTDAARDFEARVNRHLRGLAMEDATFSVEIVRYDRITAGGAEGASFLLSQKNLPPNPVSRAASGGELSRILIAIQASIEPSRLPGSIVFDEVEAGLGGRTALLAGEKLRELSKLCRIILITHEATIAAMADQHFLVRRTGDETEVREIDSAARELEIARMLAGSDAPEALEHARALLRGANRGS